MQSVRVTALDAVSPASTQTSAAISAQGISSASFHAILSGSTTPNVTIAFYASNEVTPTNWKAVANGSSAFSDNGQLLLVISSTYRWLQIVSSNGGGTSGGSLTVEVFGNGQN